MDRCDCYALRGGVEEALELLRQIGRPAIIVRESAGWTLFVVDRLPLDPLSDDVERRLEAALAGQTVIHYVQNSYHSGIVAYDGGTRLRPMQAHAKDVAAFNSLLSRYGVDASTARDGDTVALAGLLGHDVDTLHFDTARMAATAFCERCRIGFVNVPADCQCAALESRAAPQRLWPESLVRALVDAAFLEVIDEEAVAKDFADWVEGAEERVDSAQSTWDALAALPDVIELHGSDEELQQVASAVFEGLASQARASATTVERYK